VADVVLRAATLDDVPAIARVWHAGWHDAHDGRVPASVVALRTQASFLERAVPLVPHSIVADRNGEVIGFTATGGDEVAELFVADEARGTSAARRLLRAAEEVVRRAGHDQACLGVVTGNARARRFYEREGWRDGGDVDNPVEGRDGPIPVSTRLYLKDLARPPLAEALGLEPHPEGGWYRQTWVSAESVTLPDGRVRPTATLIHFLLPAGEYSAWHRVASDEVWLAHTGTVTLELGGPAVRPWPPIRKVVETQVVVPAGHWQRTVPSDADALVSCLVSPGFDFADFELA
jgi:predicted cupin superfamily sugar epimerase/GNAT superfamily N-acetyltransferase